MKVNKKGFTLMEIVIAVLIIGVLAAVAVPAYMRAMEKSKATEAIQALSDIAKGEHDYYLARSRYADDFEDMDIRVFADTTGDTHEGKYFTYTLEDETAVAERNGGDDPYTLYRVYDDPRTYCQPESNKYCKMLGLPAGDRNSSVGNWQRCDNGYPCTKACIRNITTGYTCVGTYNEDGTFSEKVCDVNGYCAVTQYNEDQKGFRTSYCFAYDEHGKCTAGSENMYDENGNLLSNHRCTAWAEDGTCTAGQGSNVYTYDENGNRTSSVYCSRWNTDGTCAQRSSYSGQIFLYDENGNNVSKRNCSSWSGEVCTSYGPSGYVYDYDENGNLIMASGCNSFNNNGTCASYNTTNLYTYDENGNRLTRNFCNRYTNENGCEDWGDGSKGNMQIYTYDANGNQTAEINCLTINNDGTCAAYNNTGSVYTYDENGNKTSYAKCTAWNRDNTCKTYGAGQAYVYDANGNQISSPACKAWKTDGSCKTYGTYGAVYTYDSNGNQITSSSCKAWNANGSCKTYSSLTVNEYDAYGHMTSSRSCPSQNLNAQDGTCNSELSGGIIYSYDEQGNISSQTYCSVRNSDGSCAEGTRYCYLLGSDGKPSSTLERC